MLRVIILSTFCFRKNAHKGERERGNLSYITITSRFISNVTQEGSYFAELRPEIARRFIHSNHNANDRQPRTSSSRISIRAFNHTAAVSYVRTYARWLHQCIIVNFAWYRSELCSCERMQSATRFSIFVGPSWFLVPAPFNPPLP